jgi:3-hydroxyisobutyrate dehydrogenase-like beta-hydroxyacid dehydrogenase
MGNQAVTVLGLGPMGQALAGTFLAAGHPTTVWNRTAARADDLVERGATRSPTVTEALGPLVIVCLQDDDAVHEVLDPVAHALRGRTVINLTSVSPEQARTTATWATGQGIDYLSGAIMTPTPIIGQPSALVLYSGPEDLYLADQNTLASIGGTATYLGDDPGRAAAYDVALLDIFWTSVTGLLHGLALARAEGIAGSEFAPYAQQIFGLLPEMTARFARQADEGNHPGDRSTIASAGAGLDHIIETSRERHLDTGALAAAKAIVQRAIDAGHGGAGLSALVDTVGHQEP